VGTTRARIKALVSLRQDDGGEVRLDPGKAARFSALKQVNYSFDRFLSPHGALFAGTQDAQKNDPGPQRRNPGNGG
jgi:hypothetical protein